MNQQKKIEPIEVIVDGRKITLSVKTLRWQADWQARFGVPIGVPRADELFRTKHDESNP